MKIDLRKLELHHWFEDEEGNVYEGNSANLPKNKHYFTYHNIFPCTYTENVDCYTLHPSLLHENNTLYQMLLHIHPFYNFMIKRMQKRNNPLTFKHLFGSNVGYGSKWSQECIIAMVNSGDYTLEQAIYVYCNACERCTNVLLYKYLDGKEGYPEYSEEWKKCNTICNWCRDEEYESRR